jgi:CHAT domain-containing protein/tetratricopeptide (TPR) repeat protein
VDAEALIESVREFLQARSWSETQRVVKERPELLGESAAAILERLRLTAQERGDALAEEAFSEHLALLLHCREVGVQQAFLEKAGGADQVRSAELARLLSELSRPFEREELERRISLCHQAIQLASNIADGRLVAVLYSELGQTLVQRVGGDRADNLERAIDAYEQALRLVDPATAPREWAAITKGLGDAYVRRVVGDRAENVERAIEAYQRTLHLLRREDRPLDWATAMADLAKAYQFHPQGDRPENLERAIGAYEQALRVLTREEAPSQWATAMSGLAAAYASRTRGDRVGNLERAIDAYEQALLVLSPKTSPSEWATILNNLGTVYASRLMGDRAENLERAVQAYRGALEVRTPTTAPHEWATTMSNLGNVLSERFVQTGAATDLDGAIQAYEVARQALDPETAPQEAATVIANLANAYCLRASSGREADNLDRALRAYHDALQLLERDAAPTTWGQISLNLGTAYANRTQATQSHSDFRNAVMAYEAALNVFSRHELINEQLKTSVLLAELHISREDWEAAFSALQHAIEASEMLRLSEDYEPQNAGGPDGGRAGSLAAYCLVQLGRVEEALTVYEASKNAILSDQLGTPGVKTDDTAVGKELSGKVARIRHLKDRAEQANVYAIRASLPDSETALIEFLITDFGSAAFIIHKETEGLSAIQIPGFHASDLRAMIFGPEPQGEHPPSGTSLRRDASDAFSPHAPPSDTGLGRATGGHPRSNRWLAYRPSRLDESDEWWVTADHLLAELYDRLWQPVSDSIAALDVSRIVVVPHQGLHLVPLHAAYRLVGGMREYVIDRFEVVYTPSAYIFVSLGSRSQVQGLGRALIVANPTGDLPFASLEAKTVAQSLGAEVQVLDKEEATRSAFLEGVRDATVLHYSGHGVFDPHSPKDSALLLSGGSPLTLSDIKHVRDVGTLNLVTLSACETAVVDVLGSDSGEYVGLPAGFLWAGVQTVVGSLWPTTDLASALLMRRFYESHLAGLSVSASLRQAQLWLRHLTWSELDSFAKFAPADEARHPMGLPVHRSSVPRSSEARERPFAHPLHWAGFVVLGRPS